MNEKRWKSGEVEKRNIQRNRDALEVQLSQLSYANNLFRSRLDMRKVQTDLHPGLLRRFKADLGVWGQSLDRTSSQLDMLSAIVSNKVPPC